MLRVIAVVVSWGLVLLPAPDADAGACDGLVSVQALGPKLPRNGVVLLEIAWGVDRAALVTALGHVRFVGANTSIDARLLRSVNGGRLQALLAPVTELPAETTVHLSIGMADIDARLATQELVTTATTDDSTPVWSDSPVVGKRRILTSNKGDSVDVYAVQVPIDAPAFVLATIESDRPKEFAIYPAAKDGIAIGRKGCNSAWSATSGGGGKRVVRVDLTAIGGSGREVHAPGKPLRLRF